MRKTNLLHEIMRADPNFLRDKTLEPEYEMPLNRWFEGITAQRGACRSTAGEIASAAGIPNGVGRRA
jgi:hypothetical protein